VAPRVEATLRRKHVFRPDDVDAMQVALPKHRARSVGLANTRPRPLRIVAGSRAANETTRRFRQTQPRRLVHAAMSSSSQALVKAVC
jgi:hypothetical protein